jgi:hypothetical protein
MNRWNIAVCGALAFPLALILAAACDRGENFPAETTTRSAEITAPATASAPRPASEVGESRLVNPARRSEPLASMSPSPSPIADGGMAQRRDRARARDAGVRRGASAAAYDPRFDAARLSIVGSAEERDKNLGLVRQPAIRSVESLPVLPPGAPSLENHE